MSIIFNNLGPWPEREYHTYPSMFIKYKASGFLEFPFDQQFNIFHHISTIYELQDHINVSELKQFPTVIIDYRTIDI